MPVVSVACTLLPGSTRRMPVRPAIGAVMLVYCSCVRALSMSARSTLICACSCSDQRALRVQHLLAGQILRRQLHVALQIALGAVQLRAVLRFGADRLIERRLQRPRIDLRQQLAFLDHLALDEGHALQLPVDTRSDLGGVEGLHVAEALQIYRHVAARRQRDFDRDRVVGLGGSRSRGGLA